MKKRLVRIGLVALCLLLAGSSVAAAESQVLESSSYCYTRTDFSTGGEQGVRGIFVTAVPEEELAAVMLGSRVIRPGDVLCSEDLPRLRLQPVGSRTGEAVLCYYPIYGTVLGEADRVRIRVCSGKNRSPKAEDSQLETYKNVANEGKLRGSDPENAPLRFALAEAPRQGTVTIREDGSYLYTPEKNRVGSDSFTFTVTDEAGNVSVPATVKITILKPTEARSFADLEGSPDAFEAMWMQQQGLTQGQQIGQLYCFGGEETVSRAEFVLMVMALWDMEPEQEAVSCFADDNGDWLNPWLTAALRRGLIRGEAGDTGLIFRAHDPITAAEAAVVLQNVLQLPVPAAAGDEAAPVWAASSLSALGDAGLPLPEAQSPLTRLQTAKLLYAASKLKDQ